MKKRILIDATTVIEKKDGLSQYIISLLNYFPPEAFEIFEFSVLINKGVKREALWEVLNSGKFKIVTAKIAAIGPLRDWDLFWFFRKHKKEFDLFHSTSNQYPLSLKNGIATVHDITFRKYLDTTWWSFKIAPRYLDMVIKGAIRRSASVIAVSNATKNALTSTYRLNQGLQEKIEVIYEGWEHLLKKDDEPGDGSEFEAPAGYLFYVGTTRVHKNIKNLLKAFAIAKRDLPENISLVVSGNETYLDPEDREIITKINAVGKSIFFTGFVSKNTLEHLFRNADAFIFPSFSEGFGIPVLEAFYFKKPLLCSNATSLPEIAGDAALYFDPSDPKNIAATIIHFYSDRGLWESLISKGEQQLQLFSWKKTAAETLSLYKKVLGA
jgi:glycosyltransferase involved in cell wall biosynthesis